MTRNLIKKVDEAFVMIQRRKLALLSVIFHTAVIRRRLLSVIESYDFDNPVS